MIVSSLRRYLPKLFTIMNSALDLPEELQKVFHYAPPVTPVPITRSASHPEGQFQPVRLRQGVS